MLDGNAALWVSANLVTALAAFVQASSGVGFAMVALPLLALIDLRLVPGPMLVAAMSLAIAMTRSDRSAIQIRELRWLLPALLLGTAVGAGMLYRLPVDSLDVVFGLIVLLAIAVTLVTPRISLSRDALFLGGFAAGAMGTVSGIHGPALAVLYQREPPEKTRATVALALAVAYACALIALWTVDLFDRARVLAGVSLLPGTLLGLLCARGLNRWLSDALVRAGLLSVSAVGAALLVIRSLGH